jgi:flagellar hook assembly protein FlgD
MQKLVASLVAAAALVGPPLARAGDVAMRTEDVPAGPRALATAHASMHFNMLGLHWRGRGPVAYRTHRLHAGWTGWVDADADSAPDGGTGPWHDGGLAWTGAADAFQVRRGHGVTAVRAYELWSRVTAKPSRTLSQAGSPAIVTRTAWAADEKIVRAKPLVVGAEKLAIVHHTAGANAYTRAQAPAIVRGIEVYHVKGNGWNDIGYNFLVDRFGNVYEGRRGGIDKNVVGAHAEGFNTGSIGVALIGNFMSATPPKAMQDALVELLAWRLDLAHVDPLSTVVYSSGGNPKFKAGRLVTLRAVSGHRDTGPSECPGTNAYRLLPAIAKRVSRTGLPKIYAPTVAGALGGRVRFQARVSAALPWTVTVTDRLGKTVASGSGTGPLVDWRWNSLVAGMGAFTWTIATPGALVATGTIGVGRPAPPPLSLTDLATVPAVLDGDATVTFTLGADAVVTARVEDASGATVAFLLDEERRAGQNAFSWPASSLADGRYRLLVTAKAGSASITKADDVIVDRTLTALAASPPAISPNGDGVDDSTTFSFALAGTTLVRLDVEQEGGLVVATPLQGELPAGAHAVGWDGTSLGAPLPDGRYTAVVTVADALGDVQYPLPFTIDTKPPTLGLVDPSRLAFTLDEPATVTVLVNGRTRIVASEQKGPFTIRHAGPVSFLTAEAQDAAGNLSPVLSG